MRKRHSAFLVKGRFAGRAALAMLGLLQCFCPRARAAAATETATVRFIYVDQFGSDIPCQVLSFANTSTRRDWASRFKGAEASGIPYGTYTYNVVPKERRLRGLALSGELVVEYPEYWLTLSYNPSAIVLPNGHVAEPSFHPRAGYVVHGRITPVPAGSKRTWVLLQALYTTWGVHNEASVDPSGEFRVYAQMWGTYILVVLHGTQVLGTRVVSFGEPWTGPAEKTLLIELPKEPVPIIAVP